MGRDLKIGEFCKKFGITPQTARAWERQGIIHPKRTAGGHRRYSSYNIMEAASAHTKDKLVLIDGVHIGLDASLEFVDAHRFDRFEVVFDEPTLFRELAEGNISALVTTELTPAIEVFCGEKGIEVILVDEL